MIRTPFNSKRLQLSVDTYHVGRFVTGIQQLNDIGAQRFYCAPTPQFQAILESYPRCARNEKAGRGSDLNRTIDLLVLIALLGQQWFNPHPVIRGLWGPGMHENCHYLKMSLNLFLGFHVILKNVAWYHSWMFLYSVGELKNNHFEYNENCT